MLKESWDSATHYHSSRKTKYFNYEATPTKCTDVDRASKGQGWGGSIYSN